MKDFIGKPCVYCRTLLTEKKFSVDHRTPVPRPHDGGSYDYANLWVCCLRCNGIKGNMTGAEFNHLLEALHLLAPVARQSVLARLRAGGKLVRS